MPTPTHLRLDVVNAFSNGPFTGNPAGVIVLDEWLPGDLLQAISEQNNLSETAFVLREPDAEGLRGLRWMTPAREVRMCGHATLAAAAVLRERFGVEGSLRFSTLSGELGVAASGGSYQLDFPADEALAAPDLFELASQAAGHELREDQVFVGTDDAMIVLDSAEEVERYTPLEQHLRRVPKRGLILTAAVEPGGAGAPDVVSRCFYPEFGILEDPATGSAHTLLGPFWSRRLGRSRLVCLQASRRRGYLTVDYDGGERVRLSGAAQHYLTGEIVIPELSVEQGLHS